MDTNKLQEKVFEKFFRCAEIARFAPPEREAYEGSLKYYRDLKNSFDTAREEGREEGEALGKLVGKIEGKIEGKLEGKLEGMTEVAKALLALGDNDQKIAQVTGLSIDEIVKLRL